MAAVVNYKTVLDELLAGAGCALACVCVRECVRAANRGTEWHSEESLAISTYSIEMIVRLQVSVPTMTFNDSMLETLPPSQLNNETYFENLHNIFLSIQISCHPKLCMASV